MNDYHLFDSNKWVNKFKEGDVVWVAESQIGKPQKLVFNEYIVLKRFIGRANDVCTYHWSLALKCKSPKFKKGQIYRVYYPDREKVSLNRKALIKSYRTKVLQQISIAKKHLKQLEQYLDWLV